MSIKICTDNDYKNALAWCNMAVSDIPRNHRRVRIDRELAAIHEYFDTIFNGPTVENPFVDIPAGTKISILYESPIQLGTRKWSDIRRTWYSTGNVTVTRCTEKCICYVDGYDQKKHMLLTSVIAIVKR